MNHTKQQHQRKYIMSKFTVGQPVILIRHNGPKVYTVERVGVELELGKDEQGYNVSTSLEGTTRYNIPELFELTEENCNAINALYGTEFEPEREFEIEIEVILKRKVTVRAISFIEATCSAEVNNENGVDGFTLDINEDFHDISFTSV